MTIQAQKFRFYQEISNVGGKLSRSFGGMKRGREEEENEISYINKSDPLFSENNGASPIIARKINFGYDSDSDPEIIITSQANKRRKMADDELKLWFTGELTKHLADLSTKTQLNGVLSAVEKNAEKITQQGEEIAGMRATIRKLELEAIDNNRSFDARVKKLMGGQPVATGSRTGPSTAVDAGAVPIGKSVERIEEEKRMFQKARRSLRIWPLPGDTNDELLEAVKEFCHGALLLPKSSNLGIESVSRVRSSPRSQSFLEVVVTFEDNYMRDKILACGPKLAGYRDENGQPTCGLRLQIPGHLMGQFKTLENFAFAKKRAFNGQVKKHVKFGDIKECLYIQMKHLNDEEWSNFSYEQALEEQEKGNAKRVKKSLLLKSPSNVREPITVVNSPPKTGSKRRRPSGYDPVPRSGLGLSLIHI